jgi:hypothetical protein
LSLHYYILLNCIASYYTIYWTHPIFICFQASQTAMDALSESLAKYKHHRNLPEISPPAAASGRTIHVAFPFEYPIAGWALIVNINAHTGICHLALHRLPTLTSRHWHLSLVPLYLMFKRHYQTYVTQVEAFINRWPDHWHIDTAHGEYRCSRNKEPHELPGISWLPEATALHLRRPSGDARARDYGPQEMAPAVDQSTYFLSFIDLRLTL